MNFLLGARFRLFLQTESLSAANEEGLFFEFCFIDLKLLSVYAKKLQRCHTMFIKISYNKKHKIDFERTYRI